MHRVELKESIQKVQFNHSGVPNAPCGVESIETKGGLSHGRTAFLMHRVELKAEVPKDWPDDELPCS